MAPATATAAAVKGEEEKITLTGPPFKLELTIADQARPPNYPKTILVFKLPEKCNQEELVGTLKTALQSLIYKIPWLAAYVRPNPELTGLLTGLVMRGFNKIPGLSRFTKPDPAVAARRKLCYYVEPGPFTLTVRRSTGINFLQMKSEDFKEAELCPCFPIINEDKTEEFHVFGLNLIFTDDGYLLMTTAMHHGVWDGFSHMKTIEWLADECRLVHAGEIKDGDTPSPWAGVFDRSSFNGPASAKPSTEHPAVKIWAPAESVAAVLRLQRLANNQTNIDKRFRIPLEAISKLRAGNNDATLPKLTDHDLACALLWRSIMAARLRAGKITADSTVGFGLAVDLRRILPPRDSEVPYLGNALSAIQANLPLADLMSPNGIQIGAGKIRECISKIDSSEIQTIIDVYTAAPDLRFVQGRGIGELGTTFTYTTSWHRFSPSALKWGPLMGEYIGCRLPNGGRPDGFSVLLPHGKDKAFVAAVVLEEKAMKAFEEDEVWKEYAELLI